MRLPTVKPELLAPAGDFEKLRFAFAYGADAVYAGLPMFSLRTRENRFDLEGVKRAIEYTHSIGKKIYITANIYAHNIKIEPFLEAMDLVVPLGADAYIMSDPGLIDLVKERYPQVSVHLSTQANNTNWAQARFWKKLGVSRIILARELALDEVQEITTKNPDLETEIFVHGALCMAYSGRCLLSDYFTGRPSNSGACTQSCRWQFNVTDKDGKSRGGIQDKSQEYEPQVDEILIEEVKRPGRLLPVVEDEFGTYIFNSKDLCTLELLPQILATGVDSIKIEGRNKNFLYLATVLRAYRAGIDACLEGPSAGAFEKQLPHWLEELTSINQRGYTQGFLKGPLSDMMNYQNINSATHAFGGKIINFHPDHFVEIDIKHKLSIGDDVEWLTPQHGNTVGVILKQKITQILNGRGEPVTTLSAGTEGNPRIYSELDLNEFCLLRVKKNKGPGG